jgi:hypothetical protein
MTNSLEWALYGPATVVCAGDLALVEVQKAIVDDWIGTHWPCVEAHP